MPKMIVTYAMNNCIEVDEYESDNLYNCDVEAPQAIQRKFGLRSLPDDFQLIQVYSPDDDEYVQFSEL